MISPRAKRFWQRGTFFLFVGLSVFVLSGVGGSWLALQRLALIAQWGFEKSFPGLSLELNSLHLTDASTLQADGLVIRAKDGNKELLRLDSGSIRFDLLRVFSRHVRLIELENPSLVVSPELFAAFAGADSASASSRPATWLVERMFCPYGEIRVRDLPENIPELSMKFAFDFQNLGTEGQFIEQTHIFTVWDLRAHLAGSPNPPFLILDLLTLSFSLDGLLQKQKISSLTVQGGVVQLGSDLQSLFAQETAAQSVTPKTIEEKLNWTIDLVTLAGLSAHIVDPRPELQNIQFTLETELRNVPLAHPTGHLGQEIQTIELSDLEIPSPLAPERKIFTLRSVFLRFTLAQLLRQEIEELAILSPTLYVGEDLFHYMETMERAEEGTEEAGLPPWLIRQLRVHFGRLVIGGSGEEGIGLPLNFSAQAPDISLDNLAALQIDTQFHIPEEDYTFPDYQVSLKAVSGEMYFSYPPGDAKTNVVNVARTQEIRWRQYQARDAWLTVTYDQSGINGRFGAHAYQGYIDGGFTFLFQSSSPWIGWLGGKQVSLEQLTKIAAPQNIRMTGPLQFSLAVDARASEFQRIKGNFRAMRPGTITITKINELLDSIPEQWNSLKQDSMKIALEALRDFDYKKANGEFWFANRQGTLTMQLTGPTGSRNFEVFLHNSLRPEKDAQP